MGNRSSALPPHGPPAQEPRQVAPPGLRFIRVAPARLTAPAPTAAAPPATISDSSAPAAAPQADAGAPAPQEPREALLPLRQDAIKPDPLGPSADSLPADPEPLPPAGDPSPPPAPSSTSPAPPAAPMDTAEPAPIPSTSAGLPDAEGPERPSSRASSPPSEMTEEYFERHLHIRDLDAPIPPEYDVPYDTETEEEDADDEYDEDEVYEEEEEKEPQVDYYAEVEEVMDAMAEGPDKLRLGKLVELARECDQRVKALERQDVDMDDEAAYYQNTMEQEKWKKRSAACLEEIVKLAEMVEEEEAGGGRERALRGFQMRPFVYKGSGVHRLDQCLTRMVQKSCADNVQAAAARRAGQKADFRKDYSEEHVRIIMQKIAAEKKQPRLRHEETRRPLDVQDVYPRFHRAVKQYRAKMFRKTVVPKFAYSFDEPQLPRDFNLEQRLLINQDRRGFLDRFAEEYEAKLRAEGLVVERDEANPGANKPDFSNDEYDLVEEEDDDEGEAPPAQPEDVAVDAADAGAGRDGDVAMEQDKEEEERVEDGIDAQSSTTEEPEGSLPRSEPATASPGSSKRKSPEDDASPSPATGEGESTLKRSKSEVISSELDNLHIDAPPPPAPPPLVAPPRKAPTPPLIDLCDTDDDAPDDEGLDEAAAQENIRPPADGDADEYPDDVLNLLSDD
ncbi:uncharacterized protein LOC129599264 isoform X2 [Paramacrobiotus metropolitanus]|nr:uncharacterized protein LOC129599264 isoform X2 [Paramacrobiotus metropolitanus]